MAIPAIPEGAVMAAAAVVHPAVLQATPEETLPRKEAVPHQMAEVLLPMVEALLMADVLPPMAEVLLPEVKILPRAEAVLPVNI